MERGCKEDGTRAWKLGPTRGKSFSKDSGKKCSGKLYEVTGRLRMPVFEEETAEGLYGETLMPAKAPRKDGKGYEYPTTGHAVGLEGKIEGERERLLYMAGY